jgi:hypothetical protein
MINLSGLSPIIETVQKSEPEDEGLLKNVRNNSIGLMNTPPDTSNIGLRHTHRGIEPYDISKADPEMGVFDSAMAGLHANSGFEARNLPRRVIKVSKSANTKYEHTSEREFKDLTRLW